ncbi:exopolysaccharide biosynthesis protein [Lysobacter capsici]|uniref:exopolysaccharide biosynthesis protein n=1 Tax=Lysobacter capsici TaxID=435897 RepID=UPI001BFFE872|nr:exopolysaccharide biosynthesis protein [Lysobacter capsici]QWF18618.1 exopolysaccharide biosynthesis protein [Lysobacter capsici]
MTAAADRGPDGGGPNDGRRDRARRGDVHEAGTRALLDAIVAGDPDEVVKFGDVFNGLGNRSFGMLLFVSTLPAFIPIPGVGGAVSGPLVVLVGLQLLIGLRRPWLPGFIARRGPHRSAMAKFRNLLAPWLTRLERFVSPRATALLDHRAANAFTGLLLVLLGILLSLPIPFTNFLFGALLLLFAFALLERDGKLMGIAWVAGVIAVAVFGVLSGSLAQAAAEWIALARAKLG